MPALLREIFRFGSAITRYLSAYITGGAIIAGLTIYERLTGRPISVKTVWWGLCGFFVVAAFQAWREQHRTAMRVERMLDQRRPEVILNFDPTKYVQGKQEFFSLANRGTVDAFKVRIKEMVNGDFTMTWDMVPTIPKDESVPATFNILVGGKLSPVLRNNAGVFLEAQWKVTTKMEDHLLKMPIFVVYEDINNRHFRTEFELTYECISKILDITFKKFHTNVSSKIMA
jgi:hypothetical protein